MQRYDEFLTIVKFLTSTQKRTLEQAISEAKVPIVYRDRIKMDLEDPVEISAPDIIKAAQQKIPLCEELPLDLKSQFIFDFERFLTNEREWNLNVTENLKATSLAIIKRFPKPTFEGNFQWRGLIVGHIQSGKTANIAALIARAADQGYRLFIVLSGLYTDLRIQTQRRLDQEITGKTDVDEERPTVEHDPALPSWVRLTKSGKGGEFLPGTHNDLSPETLKLAAIKKNYKVLERFINWLKEAQIPLNRLPAVIIDDEADHASINTNYGKTDEDGDPIDASRTNQRIRELLNLLPKCVYVGVTATPQANVLIDADVPDDLYPKDFIACLPEPPGYLGPRQLFGLGMAPSLASPDEPSQSAMDVVRFIEPDEMIELEHLSPNATCPEVLEKAILSFILSSCARLERNQTDSHFSMFIHPSQQVAQQQVYTEIVRNEVLHIQASLKRPAFLNKLRAKAEELWNSDFCKVTAAMPEGEALVRDFKAIWRFAPEVVRSIEVKTLNYQTEDELLYFSDPPKRYIIIGGNRLSRGVTLEGLSISVFLRDAAAADTLLQMGRWFGYRPNYADLTRIYVEEWMATQFADLARMEHELRADLAKYAKEPNPPTPLDIKPRLRAHPIMLVTARNKMGAARTHNIRLDGAPKETVTFPPEASQLRHNLDTAKKFISRLGKPKSSGDDGMHVWERLPATEILDLVNNYEFGPRASVVNRPVIASYITELNKNNELTQWDVVIPRGNPKLDPFSWASGIASRKVRRKAVNSSAIGVLRNPKDIDLWKSFAGRDGADPKLGVLMLYAIDASHEKIEKLFSKATGVNEDIVGLLFLFPTPKAYVPVPYISQQGLS